MGPAHRIDPGEEVGAPGERALNLVITNRAHRLLGSKGWTVLRPDLAQPPLEWNQYLAWIREQCRAGVAVLEVHGQGAGAVVEAERPVHAIPRSHVISFFPRIS